MVVRWVGQPQEEQDGHERSGMATRGAGWPQEEQDDCKRCGMAARGVGQPQEVWDDHERSGMAARGVGWPWEEWDNCRTVVRWVEWLLNNGERSGMGARGRKQWWIVVRGGKWWQQRGMASKQLDSVRLSGHTHTHKEGCQHGQWELYNSQQRHYIHPNYCSYRPPSLYHMIAVQSVS